MAVEGRQPLLSKPGLNQEFWAQLLAYDGEKWYSWQQVQPGVSGQFLAMQAPKSGTLTQFPAFEANGVSVPISTSVVGSPEGTYVKMRRAYFDTGSPTMMDVHVFEHCCGPVQCIDVVTDWQCIDGVVYLTKKRICGQFTVIDP